MGFKGTQSDKLGKRIKKQDIGMCKFEVFVPNVQTFKSVQIRLSGWVVPLPDASQRDYDKVISSTKFRLKRMVREWSESYGFYQPLCIVELDTSDVVRKKRDRSFFKLDIVLYTRDDLNYDKYFIHTTTDDIAERAVVILDQYPDYWYFTIKNSKRSVNV